MLVILKVKIQLTILLHRTVWLGASDAATEGVFRWTNGKALTYHRFSPGEPNNHGPVSLKYLNKPAGLC